MWGDGFTLRLWSLQRVWLPLLAALASASLAWSADEPPAGRTDHWAWKAPVRAQPPSVQGSAWARNPIDAFILVRLAAEGLKPSPAADRATLLRRVTFGLTGLPPTPRETDAFLNDRSPDAWERVIDRLLASPHYGERWGRHWLDLARYADSNGYEFDEPRPDAWRYRDYVIRSLNADKPYDRFAREQLAGDELDPDDPEALVATGFNVLGPDMTDASDQAKRRQDTLNDMTDTAGLVFLGLTLGCARCHDHKFDPVPQADYYRLQAFFTPAAFRRDLPVATKEARAAHATARHEYEALVRPLRDALVRLEAPYRQRLYEERLARLSDEAQAAHRTPAGKRTPAQKALVEQTTRLLGVPPEAVLAALTAPDRAEHERLRREIGRFDARKPAALPVAMGLRDAGPLPPKTYVLERGELGQAADQVEPGFPAILTSRRPAVTPTLTSTGRRSALASWIASRDNPLTARVLVNRLWQHHFGRGLVATPSDFGRRGARPTHPELLDWLAVEFMDSGWSVKHVHRLILLSATYQQSGQSRGEALEKDPDNRLLSHANRRRLEGEAIRDSLLAVSGRLNPHMGGPGALPPLSAGAGQLARGWEPSPDRRDHVRRSIYVFARRNQRFPFLEAFDLPDSNLSCPKREQSTTPPQALALLNAADVMAAAQALATQLQREAHTQEEGVIRAYRLALGRPPSEVELGRAKDFLAQWPLSELCRALFNLNEFVYLD